MSLLKDIDRFFVYRNLLSIYENRFEFVTSTFPAFLIYKFKKVNKIIIKIGLIYNCLEMCTMKSI